ncbi:MAG: hypothetical protein KAV87_02880, partial [Desulfobacteraceae bacterium]|nr:hypothetical protein [Desulfobacteraceae bacterium]
AACAYLSFTVKYMSKMALDEWPPFGRFSWPPFRRFSPVLGDLQNKRSLAFCVFWARRAENSSSKKVSMTS